MLPGPPPPTATETAAADAQEKEAPMGLAALGECGLVRVSIKCLLLVSVVYLRFNIKGLGRRRPWAGLLLVRVVQLGLALRV